MTKEHFDLLGREIKEDNYIAYSASTGSSSKLRIGIVLKLTKNRYNNPTIRIIGMSWYNSMGWEVLKEGTIHNLKNVIVLDSVPDLVPGFVREKLGE